MAQQDERFQVLVVDPDDDVRGAVTDALAADYPVCTASSLAEAKAAFEYGVDCLVGGTGYADGGVEGVLELGAEWEVPVVVFASTLDPDLVRTATRTDAVDLVLREAARAETRSRGESDRDGTVSDDDVAALRNRIDAVYRRSIADISEAVLDASRSLMGAATDEVDTKIEWELKTVGQQLDADRCSFYRYDDDREVFERTHGWTATDDEAVERTVSTDRFPGFEAKLQQFDSVTIPSPDGAVDGPGGPAGGTDDSIEIPDGFVGDVEDVLGGGDGGRAIAGGTPLSTRMEGDLPRFLSAAGLESFCAVPVVIDWELYGVLAVGRTRRLQWRPDVERQLGALGEFVGHSLRRRGRRRELERQNERLERFASVVSHDLQSPINVITGYTELVLDGGDREQLTEVLASARRMERLVDDLLALAREGEAVGDTEPIAIGEVATRAWGSVETPDAELRIDSSLVAEADPSRLQQVFENLFKNAIEHGGDDVTVRIHAFDGGFAVEDDGPGIPDEDRDEVFQEGYTGGGGTGLGLSIVRSVVEAHGWSIEVAEGTRGGARFEISIDG